MGLDSISKVQNSNSKRTKVLNFISRWTTVRNSILRQTNSSPKLHFKADHCLKLHFETDHCPDVPFRRLDSIRRSRVTIFEGHLKVQTKPGLFKGLECSISKAGLYLKSRARQTRIFRRFVLPGCHSPWLSRRLLMEFRRSTVFFRSDKILTFDTFSWIEVKSCLLESNQLEYCPNH
ncbi:hypothetical protein RclHR1_15300003 [Rhizophagus clarus]|uniref:Uncharacterized protein n=1 Tax=Rhizophagus clarus TaxID=94130 RepID=A0A2Z6QF17_9GLOM|nr:hypothetical protein RclHR1_15300003 [Rhizophagus clarus]